MINEKNGKIMKEFRQKKGYTQEELGEKAGISRQSISQFERGKLQLSIDVLERLAYYLDTSIVNLIYGGENPNTILFDEVKKPLDRLRGKDLQTSKDGFGKDLLDYAIELNSIPKFKYFYEMDMLRGPLHSNIDLLCFLIKNNEVDFLKEPINSIIDQNTGEDNIWYATERFEFPIIEYVKNPNKGLLKRSQLFYDELSIKSKKFIDAVFKSGSVNILSLLNYGKRTINKKYEYPIIFFMAIERNVPFVVEYYYKDLEMPLLQKHFDLAVSSNSMKVATFIFDNFNQKTIENLNKITNTRFVKTRKEELFNIDERVVE